MNEYTSHHTTTAELDHGVLLVSVSGVLDTATRQPVAAEFDSAFDARPAALVLDLREVTFMGSVGIALLVNAHHRANRLRTPLAIVADHRSVLRPLQISQVDGELSLHPTLDQAVAAVRLVST